MRTKFVYSKGDSDVSVTELLRPPRQRALQIRHDAGITVDAMDRLYALLGTALHAILSRKPDESDVSEERLYLYWDGWRISGQVDLQTIGDAVTITDYKLVSTFGFQSEKPEWEQQLNLYRLLVEKCKSLPVSALRICVILRDWRKMEAVRDKYYPQSPVQLIPVPMWELDEAERFLAARIAAHQSTGLDYDLYGDEALPECTSEERWIRQRSWVVQRQGATRASRVFETEAEARAYAGMKPDLLVVAREGKPIRCQHFCEVAPFCSQHKAWEAAQSSQAAQADTDDTML